MRFASFNVNGIRAVQKNIDFKTIILDQDFDAIGLQEIKANREQVEIEEEPYFLYWNSAEKKGYSGTAIFSRKEPLAVTKGIGISEFDQEGRVITAEYAKVYFVNVYVPNSQPGLVRLDYRRRFNQALQQYLIGLDQVKPVILCGDLNVAHQPIDLANPQSNSKNPGYSPEERQDFGQLLDQGFVDVFRALNPTQIKYTWWSYQQGARERNVGWRIDYFIISQRLLPLVQEITLDNEVYGSDHCPVYLDLTL
jgi:exodeoxyribonuclease-3